GVGGGEGGGVGAGGGGGPVRGAGGLLEQVDGRRSLQDEGKAPVLKDRDLRGDDVADLLRGPLVIGPAELHDVDAVGSERRPDGGRRGGRAGRRLDLRDRADILLTHFYASLFWSCLSN